MGVSRNRNISVETVNVPKMDRPSLTLARFMDSMHIAVVEDEDGDPVLALECQFCYDVLFILAENHTLRELFNGALAHDCD